MTVLLVDDSHLFANGLRRLLLSHGVQSLIVAVTRQEGVSRLTPEVRAVLVDFDLGSNDPNGGGIFLAHLEYLKNQAFRVLLTGHESAAIRATAARHRAVWLLKGEPIDTLLDLLAVAGVPVQTRSGVHPAVHAPDTSNGAAKRDRHGRWHSRGRQEFLQVVENLTRARVAEVLKLTSAMVSALAMGARQPSLRLAAAIENHFGVLAASWAAAEDAKDQLGVDANQHLVDSKNGSVR